MKVLVVSDLHGQLKTLEWIDAQLCHNRYSAVFCCGDLCNAHDPNNLLFADQFIKLITRKHQTPLYLIHGNQETAAIRLLYQHKDVTVHLREKKLGQYRVVGVGFGELMPSETDFASGKILLTHEPFPAALIKKMINAGHIANAPLWHFSGHLHQLEKVHLIDQTIFVQVPTAQHNRAAVADLGTKKVTFIDLA